MMTFIEILTDAVAKGAADIFIISGLPISYKINGIICKQNDEIITPQCSDKLVNDAFEMENRSIDKLTDTGDDDFSISVNGLSRFRVSAYKQRGTLAAVIRCVPFDIPSYEKLGIPKSVMEVSHKTKGLVLVSGPAGGGKSTTLACIIDEINKTRNGHIITLEEPIEYLHRNKKCIVSQREVHSDTESYVTALRACLRQSPDVILVGEMRDFETIKTAMTAAETGHLVISTLHSVGASNVIDRVIDVFPSNQQQQIRVQLSQLLQSVISQQLIPTVDGAQAAAFEVMHCNSAIRNMIRESKSHQIDTVIASSYDDGMYTMDSSILKLYNEGKISRGNALKFTENPDVIARKINSEN